MSEDTPAREPDQTPVADTTIPAPDAAPESVAPAAATPSRRSTPGWLPYLLVAVVPAVIVGFVVYFVAGGDDGGGRDRSAAVIDGFVHSSGPNDADIKSYKGQVPPGFPKDFPLYSGAKPVSSFLVASDEGRQYFAIFSTSAPPEKVYDYYIGAMDKDPWQVQVAASGAEFTGMRFTNPSNPDVEGEVAVYKSDLDADTHIYVTFQDESADARRAEKPKTDFKLGESYALPSGFPSDVPLYDKSGKPIVIETYFERSPGVTEYSASFLTKGSQGDVIRFYEDELKKKGWEIREPPSQSSRDFALARAFTDNKQIQGTVSVDTFEKDSAYQKVDLFVEVSRSGGGNQPGSRPSPQTSPTPRQGN
jgi:hypothetical protein